MSHPDADKVPPANITDRLPEISVTDRLETRSVTERLSDNTAFAPIDLSHGEMVCNRYRVEAGPLGITGGEADVYRCRDEQNGQIVALKFYRMHIKPRTEVLDKILNLNHSDIVTLKAFSTWGGRFLEIVEFCEGGSAADYMPFDESELKSLMQEIITGLQYLHQQGVIHRDLKPSNLFFREREKRDLVIGDFGISSILNADELVRKTTTHRYMTLDYAAPELLSRDQQISPKTDYYAMGITLIHLLSGHSPFTGLDERALLAEKFRGQIPLPESISADFQRLLKGLIRPHPSARWGYDQVLCWLKGRPICADDGRPDREDIFGGRDVAYPFFDQIKNPQQMAARLHEFNAKSDLFKGRISRWSEGFSPELTRAIIEIEEEYTDRQELGLFRLRYLLDRTLPLPIGGREVYDLHQLLDVMKLPDEALQLEIGELLYGERIEQWIEITQTELGRTDLVERIREIRKRIEDRPLGIFSLLYTLDPQYPLQLAFDVQLFAPEQLEKVIEGRTDLLSRVTEYLFRGYLAEWLRAAFPERDADVLFVERCRTDYKHDRDLGTYAVRWCFCPSVPLPFDSEQITTPKQLAASIDCDKVSFDEGITLLRRGWIRTWLFTTGQLRDATEFDSIVQAASASWGQKMEAVLHLLDPSLPWPVVAVDSPAVAFGSVGTHSTATSRLRVFNTGRGFLAGTFAVSGGALGVSIDNSEIADAPITIEIAIQPLGLPVGSRQRTTIMIGTNGGNISVPVTYRVGAPWLLMLGRTALAGLAGGASLGLIRLLLQEALPRYRERNLDWFTDWHQLSSMDNAWCIVPLGILFVALIGGCVYYTTRMSQLK